MSAHLTNEDAVAAPAGSAAPAEAGVEAAPPSYEELAAELHELRKRYPEPDWRDQRPEAGWLQEHERELRAKYLGMHVAILNGAVIGVGPCELQLRIDLSRQLGIHPDRPFVAFLHYPDSYAGIFFSFE